LEELYLDFDYCESLVSSDELWDMCGSHENPTKTAGDGEKHSTTAVDSGLSPSNLRIFSLRMNDSGIESIASLCCGLVNATHLTHLTLNLHNCEQLSSVDEIGDALPSLQNLQHLDVTCSFCYKLRSIRKLATNLKFNTELITLRLDFGLCEALTTMEGLVESISHMPLLEEIMLDFHYCPLNSASTQDAVLTAVELTPLTVLRYEHLQHISISCSHVIQKHPTTPAASLLSTTRTTTNFGFLSLERMPNLKHLRLDYEDCPGLSSISGVVDWLRSIINNDDKKVYAIDFLALYLSRTSVPPETEVEIRELLRQHDHKLQVSHLCLDLDASSD